MADELVIYQEVTETFIIEAVADQGPPGPSVNPADYFQTANNFSELDTEQKKIAARQNLDLQYIDCGTFN